MKLVVCFLIVLICPGFLFSQNKFEVSFSLPDSTEVKKLSFYYYDCHKRENLPVSAFYDNNKATISQSYNTVNAQIIVEYVNGDNRHAMTIFTTEKPATVTISGPIDETDPFKNCTLTNAQNFKREFLAADEYVNEAQISYQQMYDSIAPKWKAEDSLDFYKLQEAKMAIDSKRLEYIGSKPDSYGSFVLFEKYCLSLLPPYLLLQRFNSIFPAKFRNSEEGASIKKYILNRAVIEGEKKAISFTARDINNNNIIFKDIYTKKNVLLVFWGTWCPPCIDEIPLLRKIRRRYSADQLEIVSVAVGSPIEKVRQLIKEQQMNWIHIVNDDKISLLYQVHTYPELYLIDNKGNIIYKYSAYPDLNLGNLEKILETHASMIYFNQPKPFLN
jgi:thiol-disulfide isomerase/thioredoxin